MTSVSKSRKVLVVDDEPLVRHMLDFVLRDKYEVVAVASGEEALQASQREPFPVVILDLCMEGISGIETLSRLKQRSKDQHVIILTGYQSMETAIKALNLGAFNYITKPINRNHLIEVISQGFESYEAAHARSQEMQQRLVGIHDSFFALLCHEFNTPLSAIIGFSDLLKVSPNDPEFQTWVQHIHDSGNHLHEVLMEIVDYIAAAHLAESGAGKEFTLRQMLAPVFSQAREQGIDLAFEVGGASGGVLRGPSEAILLIIKKFVRVASRRSRHVRIRAAIIVHDGSNLRITVTGTKINQRDLDGIEIERLFKPYGHIPFDEGQARSLGLELATCRKIAEYAHATVAGVLDLQGELELIAEIPISEVQV